MQSTIFGKVSIARDLNETDCYSIGRKIENALKDEVGED